MAATPERLGPYRIVDTLGAGGMGVVYLAEHAETGERVAIKTVARAAAGLLGHLRREIHTLSRIRHPGVVRIVGQGTQEAMPWFAMELLDRETMRDWLRELWPSAGRVDTAPTRGAGLEGPTRTLSPSSPAPSPAHPPAADPPADSELATRSLPAGELRPDAASAAASAPPLLPLAAGGGDLLAVLTTVCRLCGPLSYVHGEGIVHCDLKPDNVFFRAGHRLPVLADFGLMANIQAAGREILEVAGGLRGTLPYMAPEQIRGRVLDARADLYSLGCILYEGLVGRPPFLGQPQEIATQHLSGQPTAPTRLVDGVPAALDELILKLLAKQPQDRIGYADDVAAALVRLGAEPDDPGAAPPARPYLYRPQLVGRGEVMQQVLELLARVQAGSCRQLFVSGESGVGKTRFVLEAGLEAEELGFRVITGQCQDTPRLTGEGSGGTPLHPLRPLLDRIADRCIEGGAGRTRELLAGRGRLLQPYAPSLRDVPGVRDQPDPAPLAAEEARNRLFRALAETLEAFAADQPLMLILDDLQWADELTLALLRSPQLAALTQVRLLLVGTYRLEESTPEIEASSQHALAERIVLERLGAREVGGMVRDMLAMWAPPAAFVMFLTEESEGNPFFVAEYLRTAVAEKVLARDGQGNWRVAVEDAEAVQAFAALPLSGSLRDLVKLRLRGLSEMPRRMVEAASVAGREFDEAVVAHAAQLTGHDQLEALRELLARQIIEVADGAGYRFLHDKLREISYAELGRRRRRELHRRMAAGIEAVRGDRLDLALHGAAGRHFASGGAPRKAIPHLERAAELAEQIYANQQAVELLELALEQVDQLRRGGPRAQRRRAQLESGLAERLGGVLALTGQQEAARTAFTRALAADKRGRPAAQAQAPAAVRRASLLRRIGTANVTHHHHEEAMEQFALAEAALGEPPADAEEAWWRERIDIQLQRSVVEYWRVRLDDMERWLDQAVTGFEQHATPLQRTTYFQMRAALHHRRERYRVTPEAMSYSRQAYAVVEHLGDEAVVANALFERGFGHLFNDDLEQAQDDLETALEMARRIGDLTIHSRCISYLAMAQRRLGAVEEVRARAIEAIAIAKESGMNDYLATANGHLGWVTWREGNTDTSRRYCQKALDIWRPMGGVHPFEWVGTLPLFALELGAGELEGAAALARRTLSPRQQRLPDRLEEALAGTLASWRKQLPDDARRHGRRAVELARAGGFL